MPVEPAVTPIMDILSYVGTAGGSGVGSILIYKFLFSNGRSKEPELLVEQRRTNQQLLSLERTMQEGFKDLNAAILQLALSSGGK